MADKPRIVYKLVALPDGRRGLATLSIPKTSTVVETDYKVVFRGKVADLDSSKLVRVDDIVTLSIVPVGGKPTDIVPEGTSIRSHNRLVYKVGQHTTCTLNTTAGKGDGIHAFLDQKTPLLWDKLFS